MVVERGTSSGITELDRAMLLLFSDRVLHMTDFSEQKNELAESGEGIFANAFGSESINALQRSRSALNFSVTSVYTWKSTGKA